MDETRKTFSNNFENGTTILPPRITSSRSRGYVAPSRRKPPPADGEDEERVTNQRKQRYWSSYEEMYIVELWRRYKDEVTEFNKPLPVHRKIMVAMRAKDMMVTGQDCRRKMNTLNNRYKTEVQRMKLNGVKPDWRLFPLIHCIMEPKIKEFDAWHETMVVKKLLEQIPKPPELKPPVVIPPPIPVVATTVRHTFPPYRSTQLNVTPRGSMVTSSIPLQSIQTNHKIPTYLSDNTSPMSAFPLYQALYMQPAAPSPTPHTTAKSNLPFRDITLQKYEQIKLTNEILAQQRDTALKRLRLEEEGLKAFETILLDWNEQTQQVLKTIEGLAAKRSAEMKQMPSAETNNGHIEQTLSVN